MQFRFDPLVKLDNIELSDHYRAPVSVGREGRVVEVELANGDIKKYWKGAIRSTFTVSWQWLPSLDANTVDETSGRDTIRAAYKDSQTLHTLYFRDEDGDDEQYTVWVESYSEEVIRRSEEDFFWNISLTLREQ